MKKIVFAVGVVIILIGFVIFGSHKSDDVIALPPTNSQNNNSSPSPTPTQQVVLKDGTYVGNIADAFYGNMQVQVAVQNGKIVDVVFLQFPNSPGHTTEVSNFALPQLKQEAITSQSSSVDIVSGATQDSEAFRQSLQSALDKAKS